MFDPGEGLLTCCVSTVIVNAFEKVLHLLYDAAVWEPGQQFLSTQSPEFTQNSLQSEHSSKTSGSQASHANKQNNRIIKPPKTAVLEWNGAEETQKPSFTNIL